LTAARATDVSGGLLSRPVTAAYTSSPRFLPRAADPAAPIALAALLGGCSVYQTDVDYSFSEASLTTAGTGAGIPVQVDGKVGEVQGTPLETAVTAAMPKTVAETAVHYAPCAAYTECPGDHIVWTFGPPTARPVTVHPPALATNVDWIGPYHPSPLNVTVKVDVIQRGRMVASTSGQVDAANPNDPAFQELIAAMSAEVLSAPGWVDRNIDRNSPF
jgi:hypothetical protein